MHSLESQNGFTLIELVTTLIIVGIIGAFTSFFLYTGIRGFLSSRFNSETALQAQTALDRISAELRYIKNFELIPVQTPNPNSTSIEYRSRDLTGARGSTTIHHPGKYCSLSMVQPMFSLTM